MTLRLVRSAPQVADYDLAYFCGHCAKAPAPEGVEASRVCGHCGLGLVLGTHADAAPRPGDAFLVVDASLSVCAISATAEEFLGCDETMAVNRHVAEFVVAAGANDSSADSLLSLLVEAASGPGEPCSVFVRPRDEFGVRQRALIAACGPPHAALLVLR